MSPRASAQRKIVRRINSAHHVTATPTIPTASLPAHIDAWLRSGEVRMLSKKTLDQRRDFLTKFIWQVKTLQNAESITPDVIETFLIYVAKPLEPGESRWGSDNPRASLPISATTVKNFYRILRTFFNFQFQKRRIPFNPIVTVDAPTARPEQVQPYTGEHLIALVRTAAEGPYPLRDTAILLLLLDTGIRCSELTQLTTVDLDLLSRSITVKGKGNKRRTVAFGATTADALDTLITHEMRQEGERVFLNREHKPFTASGILQLIKRLARNANLPVNANVHKCRHTFGFQFIRARGGSGEFSLMAALGHTTMTTTRRYVDIARADLTAEMRQHSPVDNLGLSAPRRRGRPRK
jgi:integrase/recombinase XerD